jgi:DNA processing protein
LLRQISFLMSMPSTNQLSRSDAWLILNAIPHIGPVNTRRLLESFEGDPLSILSATPKVLRMVKGIGDRAADSLSRWHSEFDIHAEYQKMAQSGVVFTDCESEVYPEVLKTLYDPPIGLYAKGKREIANAQFKIAIVGSRRSTLYGLQHARQYAQRLASSGVCVVSGMARGVDTAAHEGALEVGGQTLAVLGNGIDIVYPPENIDLYKKIASDGLILSEFVFGRRADRQSFPMRNRIVSGLCDGVLVIESEPQGGSMITAQFAADQGREVYALPGRVDSRLSMGCHQLIREGATLVSSPEDILDELLFRAGQSSGRGENLELDLPSSDSLPDDLSQAQMKIVEFVKKEGEVDLDLVFEHVATDISSLNSDLMALELRKIIRKNAGGSYTLHSPN